MAANAGGSGLSMKLLVSYCMLARFGTPTACTAVQIEKNAAHTRAETRDARAARRAQRRRAATGADIPLCSGQPPQRGRRIESDARGGYVERVDAPSRLGKLCAARQRPRRDPRASDGTWDAAVAQS